MKLQAQLLGKLHRLSSHDRAWIVEHLSEQERAELMSSLTSPESAITGTKLRVAEPHAHSDAKSTDAAQALARMEPRTVASIARSEPCWVNAVIVSTQGSAWAAAFLEALPASLRADVERSHPRQFGAALTESVTRLILARCQGSVPAESAFERLLERLSSARSKMRMTLHL